MILLVYPQTIPQHTPEKVSDGGVRMMKYFYRASQNIFVDPSAESKHGMLQQNIFLSSCVSSGGTIVPGVAG